MVPPSDFGRLGRLYLWSVITAGFGVIAASIYQLSHQPIGPQWFVLAALTLVSGSATVKLPSTHASISISETFVFTAVLLYGPAAGTTIVTLDGLVGSFWLSRRNQGLHRPLFNMSAPAVSAWCSAHLFFAVSGISPLVNAPSPVTAILPALVLFALTYFGLNSWLIAFVIAAQKHLHPVRVWKSSFAWLSLNYFGGASVAFLLIGYNRTINLSSIGVILPLLLVLYFTFKAATGRVEDADRHVEELNRLYLSTIETLAMAIDAKDQVTHGHIRRVQQQTIALAKQVGVHDERLLKAIEAAALLHDMGKLAVPEYILNKPGKLTPAEFEKMKLHASVGADILSAIDFPYPVVPIVRHHHENWNGTGYPSGIKGTDIPIGARILAVVDCFDALTSDRPYRPKLSDAEAIQILLDRRGSMYDPLIVDSFVNAHANIPKRPIEQSPASDVLQTIHSSQHITSIERTSPTVDAITASADEMLSVYELTTALAGHVSVGDAGDIIAKHLRRLIPASTCVFYIYDSVVDELRADHVAGDGANILKGMSITPGQRLSGWVAANRQTVSNSDAALDLGETARSRNLSLRSCISTPLVSESRLIGVLTLYSKENNAFNDDHSRIIEIVGRRVAHTLRRALEVSGPLGRDSLTGLPQVAQLQELVQALVTSDTVDQHQSLLLIEVIQLRQINLEFGRPAGDEVLKHVVRQAKAGLRVADILFRHSEGVFVAFLGGADREVAETVAAKVRDQVGSSPIELDLATSINIHVKVTPISGSTADGSLDKVLGIAKQDRAPVPRYDRNVH